MNKLINFNALRHCNKTISPSLRSLVWVKKSHQSPNYYTKPLASIINSNFHSSSFIFNNQPNINEQSISSNNEKTIGSSEKYEYLAETKQLLNIVAKSLYSEKEVFIRYSFSITFV